jgi:hypothetical protein
MYEYQVGKEFINKQTIIYPCFLETYGLYKYEDPLQQNELSKIHRQKRAINMKYLKKWLQLLKKPDYKIGCKQSMFVSLLIQHIKGSSTLDSYYDHIYDNMSYLNFFYKYEIIPILFQVYMPLRMLRKQFTHYDLHTGNIMLYKPDKNKYIHYHYIDNKSGNSISFYSQYVVKIIDYGRSYFNNGSTNSEDIYKTICDEKQCDPKCGSRYGLSYLKTGSSRRQERKNYITTGKSNQSHDLRLLHILISDYENVKKDLGHPIYWMEMLLKTKYSTDYGTKENKTKEHKNGIINNVTDAFSMLKSIFMDDQIKQFMDAGYNSMTKLGDMYIYGNDKPMKYVKA